MSFSLTFKLCMLAIEFRPHFLSPGGTSGIHYNVPPNLVQVEINKAVNVKDWQRLYLLFMGGGGEKRFQKGSGGLGIGCDASSAPLEEVIPCDFPELAKFISVLLDHKAIASAQKGRKSPLDVANNLEKFDVVNLLLEKCNKALPTEVKFATSAEPHKVGMCNFVLLFESGKAA